MSSIIPKIYPKCINTFNKWLNDYPEYYRIYKHIGSPTAFDVSLRDGIQSLPSMSFEEKITMYNQIYKYHQPKNMEIGSIVSKKVLPIFQDSLKLYEYADSLKYTIDNSNLIVSNNWMLVPNEEQFNKIQTMKNMPNLSFITSVSDKFQLKNTKMTIDESLQNIRNIITRIDDSITSYTTIPKLKIYVSCISECPVDKKNISEKKIMETLLKVNSLKPDLICLSDTCGSLQLDNFNKIMYTSILHRIPLHKYCLHLHVKNGSEEKVESLIESALNYGITHFDVSFLESGGCSVTIDKKDLSPNLSYILFYKSLVNYIINMSNFYKNVNINDKTLYFQGV
jgi:isopropylmalate/homocitrate/citramalate synthase